MESWGFSNLGALQQLARLQLLQALHECRIENRDTGAVMRAIGSDPSRAHGLAPVLVIADEPAQWPCNDGPRTS